MTATLRPFLRKFCHIYINDIIIWSNSIKEHMRHIKTIMEALRAAKLYYNPKKCAFYLLELDFLGHHISACGIEANSLKVDRILDWPVPTLVTEVCSFLGLVRYLMTFLLKLADYTTALTPLTTKEAKRSFPEWTAVHQTAFEGIKVLMVSQECLMTIDHESAGEKIFTLLAMRAIGAPARCSPLDPPGRWHDQWPST
jgi:hypothetical protein